MCVIAFAWNVHPRWQLLLAGNRDELYARSSAPLQRWAETPGLLAGRDVQAGGTWMGVREPTRAAVVTNVRDPRAATDGASRGLLVTDYLCGENRATVASARLTPNAGHYRPFNLLLFDRHEACFVSNHPRVRTRTVAAGIHGLSNADFDEPWPKTQRAIAALRRWIDADTEDFGALIDALGDPTTAPDAELPDTGVGIELERRLSAVFVRGKRYGTRATTVIAVERAGGGYIVERRFGPEGAPLGQTALRFYASGSE